MSKTSNIRRRYGWKKDLPSLTRRTYSLDASALSTLPESVDLRTSEFMPPIYDQGELGSCGENSTGAAFEFLQRKERLTDFMPGRLFVYYNVRAIEGTIDSDSGSAYENILTTLSTDGVCREDLCPYDVTKFTQKPDSAAYTDALLHKLTSYKSIPQDINSLKSVLANDKLPFVFGILVYSSFEGDDAANTGIIPMPSANEENLGGHALMCVGYDDSKQCFIVRNSWGKNWGISGSGYCYFPYAYLLSSELSSDFYILEGVQQSG